MSRRDAYRVLSLWGAFRAGMKGPGHLARFLIRRSAHRTLARTMRRSGL